MSYSCQTTAACCLICAMLVSSCFDTSFFSTYCMHVVHFYSYKLHKQPRSWLLVAENMIKFSKIYKQARELHFANDSQFKFCGNLWKWIPCSPNHFDHFSNNFLWLMQGKSTYFLCNMPFFERGITFLYVLLYEFPPTLWIPTHTFQQHLAVECR